MSREITLAFRPLNPMGPEAVRLASYKPPYVKELENWRYPNTSGKGDGLQVTDFLQYQMNEQTTGAKVHQKNANNPYESARSRIHRAVRPTVGLIKGRVSTLSKLKAQAMQTGFDYAKNNNNVAYNVNSNSALRKPTHIVPSNRTAEALYTANVPPMYGLRSDLAMKAQLHADTLVKTNLGATQSKRSLKVEKATKIPFDEAKNSMQLYESRNRILMKLKGALGDVPETMYSQTPRVPPTLIPTSPRVKEEVIEEEEPIRSTVARLPTTSSLAKTRQTPPTPRVQRQTPPGPTRAPSVGVPGSAFKYEVTENPPTTAKGFNSAIKKRSTDIRDFEEKDRTHAKRGEWASYTWEEQVRRYTIDRNQLISEGNRLFPGQITETGKGKHGSGKSSSSASKKQRPYTPVSLRKVNPKKSKQPTGRGLVASRTKRQPRPLINRIQFRNAIIQDHVSRIQQGLDTQNDVATGRIPSIMGLGKKKSKPARKSRK